MTILRLFPRFRYLEEAATERTRLQDLNNTLEARVAELLAELHEARELERTAYHAMINIKCGQAVFPTAPHLRESTDEEMKPITSRYVQARDISKQESRKALDQYYGKIS